jgi:hypothetical protein
MNIIYEDNGILSVVYASGSFMESREGTEEEKLIHYANKHLPTGTKYEIVENEDFTDSTFRNAWEYVSGSNEKTSEDLSEEDLAKYNRTENF